MKGRLSVRMSLLACDSGHGRWEEDMDVLKVRWARHGVRMDHRKCELQDHLERMGGNLGAFYRFRERLLRAKRDCKKVVASGSPSGRRTGEEGLSVSGSDEESLDHDEAADVDAHCEGIGEANWFIRDLLSRAEAAPALEAYAFDTSTGHSDGTATSASPLRVGIAADENNADDNVSDSDDMISDQSSSPILSSEEQAARREHRARALAELIIKADTDPCVRKYTTSRESFPPDTYPEIFERSVPPDVLTALVCVPFGSQDHTRMIQDYHIPPAMAVVLKYAAMSFDDGWKAVQWPSLIGVVHPAVIRALYNG